MACACVLGAQEAEVESHLSPGPQQAVIMPSYPRLGNRVRFCLKKKGGGGQIKKKEQQCIPLSREMLAKM